MMNTNAGVRPSVLNSLFSIHNFPRGPGWFSRASAAAAGAYPARSVLLNVFSPLLRRFEESADSGFEDHFAFDDHQFLIEEKLNG